MSDENETKFFQGFLDLKIPKNGIPARNYFVNEIPIIVKASEVMPKSFSLIIKVPESYSTAVTSSGLLLPICLPPIFINVLETTVTEHSKNEYLLLSPQYPLRVRISIFGTSVEIMEYQIPKSPPPAIHDVDVKFYDGFDKKIKPGAACIRKIKALDGLTFEVQIVKDNGKLKYFIENPHENVWINGN